MKSTRVQCSLLWERVMNKSNSNHDNLAYNIDRMKRAIDHDNSIHHELSSYEKIRQENIRRNEEFLAKVGLSPIKQSSTGNENKTTNRSRNKIERVIKIGRVIEEPTRKSRRIEALPVISYDMKIIDKISSLEDKNDNNNNNNDDDENNEINAVKKPKSSGPRLPPSSDMSRAINAQLSDILSKSLGQHVKDYGKGAVMALCNNGTIPRFSKYSGVVEWKNAIFLWVNLGYDKSQYPNTFSEKGKYITWFGGSKMHEESEVIKRLIKLGESSYKGDENIILFVRKEGESYVCLGRLAHINYQLNLSPVTFKWRLLDYDALKHNIYFKSIINM